MKRTQRRTLIQLGIAVALAAALSAGAGAQQKKYDPGANDREIKVGHINP